VRNVLSIAGWGEDGALDAVTQSAQLIDDLARAYRPH
jgi:hypothetical protein